MKDDKKTNYITIYADDFDTDVWEDYCHTANVPLDATYITIYFKDEDVKSDATTDPEEEQGGERIMDEENRCPNCGSRNYKRKSEITLECQECGCHYLADWCDEDDCDEEDMY